MRTKEEEGGMRDGGGGTNQSLRGIGRGRKGGGRNNKRLSN